MPTDILQRYQDMLKNRKEQDARLAELMPVDTKTAGNTLNSYEQALQEAKQAQDILKLKAEEAAKSQQVSEIKKLVNYTRISFLISILQILQMIRIMKM